MRQRGASFCQVERVRPVSRLTPCITSGIQLWRGARPIFIAKARVMSVEVRGWLV